jgi:hypothetical protein
VFSQSCRLDSIQNLQVAIKGVVRKRRITKQMVTYCIMPHPSPLGGDYGMRECRQISLSSVQNVQTALRNIVSMWQIIKKKQVLTVLINMRLKLFMLD